MRSQRGIHNKQNQKGNTLLILVCVCLLIGVVFGAIGANRLDSAGMEGIGQYLETFFASFGLEENSGQGMPEIVWKYGKYTAIIWGLGLLPVGAIFILGVLIFKGMAYGFTSAVLIKQYGGKGIAIAAASYLPQNLILVPLYIFMAYIGIQYVIYRYTFLPPKARLKREKQKRLTEYVIILAAAFLATTLAAAIELYITPFFMNLVS